MLSIMSDATTESVESANVISAYIMMFHKMPITK
jgi:hypothetical protein